MRDLHLTEFEASSFAGIDSESPVVIHFKKNKNVTLLRGDQGTNKTSTLHALMTLMGATFNFEMKNFINNKDEMINCSLKFTYEGTEFEAIQTGNRLTLKRHYKETDRWIPEGSPKETLRAIFGNLGVSPMFLKDLPGKKQIEWFKETFGTNGDVGKKEKTLQDNLTKIIMQRRDLNRDIKNLKGAVETHPLYEDYEKNQAKFAKPVNAAKEKEKLESLREKKGEYDRAKHGIEGLKSTKESAIARIEALKKSLETEQRALATIEQRITDGEAYITENASIETEYEKANKAFLNISKTIVEQTQWKDLLAKEKELSDSEDAVTLANGQIDKLRAALLELTSTYLPKIKGLEIRTKGMSIDNEDEDEGIFYQGKSLAQLSESELSELFLMIWEAKKVMFVFIENISSYGSSFIKVLNDLVAEDKIEVLASQMDRKKKEMEITFETRIH